MWRKSQPGQGSFYRSQHELICVFKAGTAPHINNFKLGSEGRNRSNVLDYASGSGPEGSRKQELDMHPTVKPVALIADLMLDCSKRNGIVLDLFGGSGTTILAAENSGRRARVIEIDPLYVDLSIRRWQKLTGDKAVLASSGKTFNELAGRVWIAMPKHSVGEPVGYQKPPKKSRFPRGRSGNPKGRPMGSKNF